MANHAKPNRRDITISLLDEEAKPVIVWTLLNAWPCKIEGSSSKGDSNEIAFESITLAYEEMKIEAK